MLSSPATIGIVPYRSSGATNAGAAPPAASSARGVPSIVAQQQATHAISRLGRQQPPRAATLPCKSASRRVRRCRSHRGSGESVSSHRCAAAVSCGGVAARRATRASPTARCPRSGGTAGNRRHA
eukprot:7239603-Prymnesium_polylepis.1